jgi:peptide/nickel transport system permease protein
MMRITDVLVAFPPLILAIGIIAVTGPGLRNAMIAVGIISAPSLARVMRSSALSIRRDRYVEAALLAGASHTRVLVKHIFPNVISMVIVMANLIAASALLAEAGLSFIGLGVVPPQASWGALLKDGVPNLASSPYLVLIPGIAITLTVLALNLIGDSLRRAAAGSRR